MDEQQGDGFDRRYDCELLVRTVNQYRHDWMNDLQVLFGYIQLNKQDKIKEYIVRFSDKMFKESMMARLGDNELIAYLYAYRARASSIELEVLTAGEIHLPRFGEAGKQAAGIMIAAAEAFREANEPGHGGKHELRLEISTDEEGGNGAALRIAATFLGMYNKDRLQQDLQAIMSRLRATGSGPDAELTLYELNDGYAQAAWELRQRPVDHTDRSG